MLTVPADMPVTRPVADPTVAMAGSLLLHAPDGVASVSVVVAVAHTTVLPATGVGTGSAVTACMALQPPRV